MTDVRKLAAFAVMFALLLSACGSSNPALPTPALSAASTTTPGSGCSSIGAVPSAATAVTTAPVRFDGVHNGTLRVYRLGSVWHARGEMLGSGFDDEVISGSGPTMAALGGAKVNGDASEEAWVKVGEGSSTAIIGFYVYGQCGLRRVLLTGSPAEFPIGTTVTHADGLHCFGFGTGIEVFSTDSNDGVTYAGHSTIYTISLSGPSLVLGATANQSESSPPGGPAFNNLSTFGCGSLAFP